MLPHIISQLQIPYVEDYMLKSRLQAKIENRLTPDMLLAKLRAYVIFWRDAGETKRDFYSKAEGRSEPSPDVFLTKAIARHCSAINRFKGYNNNLSDYNMKLANLFHNTNFGDMVNRFFHDNYIGKCTNISNQPYSWGKTPKFSNATYNGKKYEYVGNVLLMKYNPQRDGELNIDKDFHSFVKEAPNALQPSAYLHFCEETLQLTTPQLNTVELFLQEAIEPYLPQAKPSNSKPKTISPQQAEIILLSRLIENGMLMAEAEKYIKSNPNAKTMIQDIINA